MALIVTILDVPAVRGMKPLEVSWTLPQKISVCGRVEDFAALPEGGEFPFQVWDEATQSDVLTMPEWSPYLRSPIKREGGDVHFTLLRPVWPGAKPGPGVLRLNGPGRALLPDHGDINAV